MYLITQTYPMLCGIPGLVVIQHRKELLEQIQRRVTKVKGGQENLYERQTERVRWFCLEKRGSGQISLWPFSTQSGLLEKMRTEFLGLLVIR